MLALFVTIMILLVLFYITTIIPDLSASDFKELKQFRMKLMGHCCANCNHYNKKTNCCTITFPQNVVGMK